ncbi:MAG: hypothetical protein LBK01_04050 [Burkholderiaceae bacterium]|jgi:hypothetical protein|nr:hypothetical protein [Burkholderiaceae bacterium]
MSAKKRPRYLVTKDGVPVAAPFLLLRDAVLSAARYGGHGAKFVRDKHGFMCFFASRRKTGEMEYIPAPCDAFRYWSPLRDDIEAEEHVSRQIMESGWLHAVFKDLRIEVIEDEAKA